MPVASEATARRRLIRLPEVLTTVGLSKSEVYRLVAVGQFPRPIPLGTRASAWDEGEIQDWVRARIADREKASHARSELGRKLVRTRVAAAASLSGRRHDRGHA